MMACIKGLGRKKAEIQQSWNIDLYLDALVEKIQHKNVVRE